MMVRKLFLALFWLVFDENFSLGVAHAGDFNFHNYQDYGPIHFDTQPTKAPNPNAPSSNFKIKKN